jgi:hypothetical protein
MNITQIDVKDINLSWYQRFVMRLSKLINGLEFIGCIFKKKPYGFTELVEKVYLVRHQRKFHARIEREFYDIKTFNFELYWNFERGNLNKVSPMSPTRRSLEECENCW